MEGGRERVLAMETVEGRLFAITTVVGNYRGSRAMGQDVVTQAMLILCLQGLLDSRGGSNRS